MKGHHEIDRIFEKYLAGDCNEQEILIFNQFIKENQDDLKVQQMIQEFAEKVQSDNKIDDTPDEQSKELYKKIRGSIKAHESAQRYQNTQIKRRRLTWLKVAAVIVWILMGIFWFTNNNNINQPETAEITFIERLTTGGQKSKVTLPDGTVVHLNSESRLRFPEQFGKTREVILEGEAFFQVTRDESKPFLVNSGGLVTQVLGTSFNIKAFSGEDIQVTVATGKVSVESIKTTQSAPGEMPQKVILTPNQQATYSIAGKSVRKLEVNTQNYIAWKDKTLKFDGLRFEEVAKILSRWYGVNITLENDQLRDCNITGEYIDKGLHTVLENLEHVLGIEYEYSKEAVTIRGEGC